MARGLDRTECGRGEELMKLLFRSLLLMAALFGLVFAVADAYLARHGVPMWQGLLFAVVCIGLQYWLGPSVIQWVLRIRWDDSRTELPARNREFLEALCTERGLEMPRIGIIDSATPNAFTFGHVPSDARIVVTTGLLAALTPEESNAVLAHEMGHVEHYDFIVMTLAALAPLLLYQLYAFTRYASKTRAVAIGAYLAYWVSQYIVLMLSRTREYFADEYSARVTRTPDALASALVKISGGMQRIPQGDLRTAGELQAFFISPVSKKIGGLFSTHPPMEQRIAKLMEYERELQTGTLAAA
jgi:heat shock protein HtpX